MKDIRIYYEGDRALKPGFHGFFSNIRHLAKKKECGFQLISTGAKYQQDFSIAIKNHPGSWNILLVDSEGPPRQQMTMEVCARNGWAAIHAESIFWMVEMMESWFHADKDAIQSFYGAGFNRNALAANPSVEQIPKKDLLDGLRAATRNTQKGPYHKTVHAPKLLERIKSDRVPKMAPNCRKLFEVLEKELA